MRCWLTLARSTEAGRRTLELSCSRLFCAFCRQEVNRLSTTVGEPRSAFRGWTPAGEGRAALLLANIPGPSVTGTSSGLTRLDLGWFFQVVLYIFQQQVGGKTLRKRPSCLSQGLMTLTYDICSSFRPPDIPHPHHVKGVPCP